MFPLQFRFIPNTAGAWVSIEVNRDGIFLFLCPFELALLWPWFKG